ncbi:MAG: hypothetical protein AB7H90_03360 [Alphaproteobacteria bacterium]
MNWAVKYGDRRFRVFHDMHAAAKFYETKGYASLWKLCSDGWLCIACSGASPFQAGPSRQEQQADRPMNREVLVLEELTNGV